MAIFVKENCNAVTVFDQKIAAWPHGRKAERKTASDFVTTERLLSTERPPKGLEMAK